jgi:hypothetical protein
MRYEGLVYLSCSLFYTHFLQGGVGGGGSNESIMPSWGVEPRSS